MIQVFVYFGEIFLAVLLRGMPFVELSGWGWVGWGDEKRMWKEENEK